MADGEYINNVNESQEKVLSFRPFGIDNQTEQGKNFWNRSQVDMFSLLSKTYGPIMECKILTSLSKSLQEINCRWLDR